MRLAAALGLAAFAAALFAAIHGPGGTKGDKVFALQADVASDVSSNWAGYVASGTSQTYTSVTGTWREPTVTCDTENGSTSSAFWVGLGGYSANSQALEQIGTSADCDDNGQPSYYAWYELVPSASVTIKKLKVMPGDLITTSVNVIGGTTIELQVKNRTRKTSYTTKLPFATPDLTSAEWIAEAPSLCNGYRCTTVPLSNFGSITFSRIAALGNGVGGTLDGNLWNVTSIKLVAGGSGRGFFPGPDSFAGHSSSTAGATPGAVSTDGRSFSVSWEAASSN